MINLKCYTQGHANKQIEYMSVSPETILLGCKQCYEENKKKYEFMRISQFYEKLNNFKLKFSEINKNILLDIKKQIQKEIQSFLKKVEDFCQSLEATAIQKLSDLLELESSILNFEDHHLQSPSQKLLKQISFIAQQSDVFIDQTKVSLEDLKDKMATLNNEFDFQVSKMANFFFNDKMQRLQFKFNLPGYYIEQIQELELQKQLQQDMNYFNQFFTCHSKLEEGVSYTGFMSLQGDFDGRGLLVAENLGCLYYGVFQNGVLIYGIKIYINTKELLKGEFQFIELFTYQLQNYGIYEKNKQIFYEGEFQNEKFNGYGVFKESCGTSYFGDFVDGKFHGHGTLVNDQDEEISGIFQNGCLEGQGKLKTKDLIYEGNFHNNKKHGQGIEENLKEKSKYVGDFVDGKREGKGTLHFSNDSQIDGTFKDGEPHGLCKWNYAKTRVENLTIITEQFEEEGEFVNGEKCGEFRLKITTKAGVVKKYFVIYDNGVEIFKEEV